MSVDQLDTKALDKYLAGQIKDFAGLHSAEKFAGGQSNPTFLLTADSGNYVLRRKPSGRLLKSAHAVDREFRVISALADTDVPVAKAYHLCEDDNVIGSMFYIMGFVEGRIFWDPALPDIKVSDRTAMYDEMNRVLAALHSVDIDAVGLSDFGKPGNYFERQVARWTTQYLAAETETIEPMDTLMRWLPEHMPADDGQVALVHGDYRLDNMIFHPTEPRILAIVDWELSTLGHPFADLAYQCMQWRLPNAGISKGLADMDRKHSVFPLKLSTLSFTVSERAGMASPTGRSASRSVFSALLPLFRACSSARSMATLQVLAPPKSVKWPAHLRKPQSN